MGLWTGVPTLPVVFLLFQQPLDTHGTLNKAVTTGPAWLLAVHCDIGVGPWGTFPARSGTSHLTDIPDSHLPLFPGPPGGDPAPGRALQVPLGDTGTFPVPSSHSLPRCRRYQVTRRPSRVPWAHSRASGPAGKFPQLQPWRRAVPRAVPGARGPFPAPGCRPCHRTRWPRGWGRGSPW